MAEDMELCLEEIIKKTNPQEYIKILEQDREDFAKEINRLYELLDKIKINNQRIIDYGFDYDGFNNVEDLKKLIDMLVDYARENNDILKGE